MSDYPEKFLCAGAFFSDAKDGKRQLGPKSLSGKVVEIALLTSLPIQTI